MSSKPSPQAGRRRRRVLLAIFLTVVVTVAYLGWMWLWVPSLPSIPSAALAANARGVAHMEQFSEGGGYLAAVPDFEEAVRLAPDWLPARVNLGIARMNADPEHLDAAVAVFNEVLRRDPNNRHALYSLGMIAQYRGDIAEAYARFEAVGRLDPEDPDTWLRRGMTHPEGTESPAAKKCFEEALRLNPYLNAARYAVAQHPHERDPERSRKLLTEHKAFTDAAWYTESGIKYSEMGKYADVIGQGPAQPPTVGPLPRFENAKGLAVTLAEGCRWSTAADLGDGDAGKLRKAVRERFGATMVLLDYDRDGRPDVFLAGAVVENERLRDLLLHNEGELRFRDVTDAAGLAKAEGTLACSAADFDNDGRTDLVLTGLNGIRLLRNQDGKQFEDVTQKAGLGDANGVCLGTAWVDLDQDADLDLVVCCYALTTAEALGKTPAGELRVFLNAGEALPAVPGAPSPGLTVAFRRVEGVEAFKVKGAPSSVVITDIDRDQDMDLIVFASGTGIQIILNDRLLRFHSASSPERVYASGALVLDATHGQRPDLLLLQGQGDPLLYVHREREEEGEGLKRWYSLGNAASGSLTQGHAIDLDLDGWTDVVGLFANETPVLLHNEGGRLSYKLEAFGKGLPGDVIAVAATDLDGDCAPDVLLWAEKDGLQLLRSLGNGNRAVRLELTGRRDKGTDLRSNADGIGAWAMVPAGSGWSGIENTTLSAGLGQSRLPLLFGVGKATKADAVRVRWPDLIPQGELDIPTCEIAKIVEINRKGTSCPVLMTWDGERFRFVCDFLGAGAMGELGADGSVRPPRPEESVKIEPGQLVPRDGSYVLKITEPMDEVLYLDRVRLDVIDHPRDRSVFPDERFVTAGPQPSQELLTFGDRVFPNAARDHRGRDVTDLVRERDHRFVEDFAPRSWLGFAEEHYLELDFADRLAKFKDGDRLFLVLAGWTDYPYPESIYAAGQAGVEMKPPVIERLQADGTWKAAGDLGFPAGLPRVITRDVTGLLTGPRCALRLRTNMQISWDQVFVAKLSAEPAHATPLEVASASLAARGFMKEVRPNGREPLSYDYDRTERVAVTRWQGLVTRTGDVTELLEESDDRFVLCGPGDEITVRFDANQLPPLPEGWQRSFVLRTWGYCKDTGPFTKTGGRVGPLPHRGMKSYPDGVGEVPAAQAEYDRRWNTRPVGRRW